MSLASAELTKYAANAMLVTRISFMNELARYCESVRADIEEVRSGIGTDNRIGPAFLYAGVGYGGSCFPKDVQALIHSAEQYGCELTILKSVEKVNREQRIWFVEKIKAHYGGNVKGKKFAVWGLSFKPNTDDMREAPSITIIQQLLTEGATIRAYDPVAIPNAQEAAFEDFEGLSYGEDPYEVLEEADGLILLTEWPLFRKPDFDRMKRLMKYPALFDGRNQYNPIATASCGFSYSRIGLKHE